MGTGDWGLGTGGLGTGSCGPPSAGASRPARLLCHFPVPLVPHFPASTASPEVSQRTRGGHRSPAPAPLLSSSRPAGGRRRRLHPRYGRRTHDTRDARRLPPAGARPHARPRWPTWRRTASSPRAAWPCSCPPDARQQEIHRMPYEHAARQRVVYTTEPGEFTALCPFSGLPDSGTVRIEYVPGSWLLELKSLKYYLMSWRHIGAAQEDITAILFEDLARHLGDPHRLVVTTDYTVRGGIHTVCTVDSAEQAPHHEPSGDGVLAHEKGISRRPRPGPRRRGGGRLAGVPAQHRRRRAGRHPAALRRHVRVHARLARVGRRARLPRVDGGLRRPHGLDEQVKTGLLPHRARHEQLGRARQGPQGAPGRLPDHDPRRAHARAVRPRDGAPVGHGLGRRRGGAGRPRAGGAARHDASAPVRADAGQHLRHPLDRRRAPRRDAAPREERAVLDRRARGASPRPWG